MHVGTDGIAAIRIHKPPQFLFLIKKHIVFRAKCNKKRCEAELR